MDNRFPAVCRLKHKKDIQAVFDRRDVFRGERLVFYRGPTPSSLDDDIGSPESPEAPSRFCLNVSKECGSAVRRNRIKRVLREIIRLNRFRIAPGFDFVIRVDAAQLKDIIEEKDFLVDFERYFGWN